MKENTQSVWEDVRGPNYYFEPQVINGKKIKMLSIFLIKNIPVDNQIEVGVIYRSIPGNTCRKNNKTGLSPFCHT